MLWSKKDNISLTENGNTSVVYKYLKIVLEYSTCKLFKASDEPDDTAGLVSFITLVTIHSSLFCQHFKDSREKHS